MTIAGILVLVLMLPVLHDLVRRPTFRRLAVRNISRRPNEALLVIVGSMLGTAIITAAFVTGDTFGASIRHVAQTNFGPVDEIIFSNDTDSSAAIQASLDADPIPNTDGVLGVELEGAAVATVADNPDDRRAVPEVRVAQVAVSDLVAFGADPSITGYADAGGDLAAGDAVINEPTARDLDVRVGDEIDLFAYGASERVTVRTIVERSGIAGTIDVLVSPGSLSRLTADAESFGGSSLSTFFLVSNDGGVYDGADRTDDVLPELQSRFGELDDVDVEPVKQDLLEDAESAGSELKTLFTSIGSFSVIAGILLLVNLFVMLAEERKSELGMLRAVGLRRNHLLRSFATEGSAYAFASSILGGLLGIFLGWVLVSITFDIFGGEDDGLVFVLDIKPTSIITAMLIGMLVSLLTIWGTSIRLSRLNVISAIRDLPDPAKTGRRLFVLFLSIAGVLGGLALGALGKSGGTHQLLYIGPAIAAFSLIGVLGRIIGPRLARIIGGVIALAWGVLAFIVFEKDFANADIDVFVMQGVVLVAAAVTLVTSFDRALLKVVSAIAGGGLIPRLGLAYPLARRFRTGLLLGMYAIVVFTLMFLSSFQAVLSAQSPGFVDDTSAGYDLYVSNRPSNPISTQELLANPNVESAAPLTFGNARFNLGSEPLEDTGEDDVVIENHRVVGFDESLVALEPLRLGARDDAYASDAEVFEAVLADPSLAVVNDWFLRFNDGAEDLQVGDSFTMTNEFTDESHVLKVAGVLSQDFLYQPVLVRNDVVTDLMADTSYVGRHFVKVAGGDPDEVSDKIAGAFVERGARATTFRERIQESTNEDLSFMKLLQGYLAIGLLIGIAGLGVVMIRAVRERRREIGMLRAMGLPSSGVRKAFLLESGFIAVQGVVIGSALGILTAWSVLTYSSVFEEEGLPFNVPWTALVIMLIVPVAASLIAAAVPAGRASRIRPAAALRMAD